MKDTQKPLEILYNKLKEDKVKVPDYMTFASNLDDAAKASKLHQFLIAKNYAVPEDFNKFSSVLKIGQGLKKKDDTTPSSSPTLPAQESGLVEENSSEVGVPSSTPDQSISSPGDLDPSASEVRIEQPEAENTDNPAKSFGKSFWKAMAYDIPSGFAGTGAVGVGVGKQLIKLPEMNARINEIVNRDSTLEKKAKRELQDISKMLGKYQKGLESGEFNEEEYKERAGKLIERANFLTDNKFTDLVEDDKATELQKGLTNWAVERQKEGAEFTDDVTSTLEQIEDPIDALNWLSSAIGQASAYIPATIVTGGATSLGVEIGSIYTESINRIAEREGITPEEVIEQGLDDPASALAFGTAAGLLDKIGADKVMSGSFKKTLRESLTKRALSGGLSEAPTEGAQTVLEQYGVMSSIDKKEDLNWNEVGEAMAQGFVGGAGISTAGAAVNKLTNKSKKNESTKPKGNSATSQNDEKSGAASGKDGREAGQPEDSNLGDKQSQSDNQVNVPSKKPVVDEGKPGMSTTDETNTGKQPTKGKEAKNLEGTQPAESRAKGDGGKVEPGAGEWKKKDIVVREDIVEELSKPALENWDSASKVFVTKVNGTNEKGTSVEIRMVTPDGVIEQTVFLKKNPKPLQKEQANVKENEKPLHDLTKKTKPKGPTTYSRKFDYEPASRQDAIAKMFGEGMRMDTDDFRAMAGDNWVKDQKALPLNYTTPKKGLKRDELFQKLSEQYPELAATTNDQDFAQEVVDFIQNYPQHPSNYVDEVVNKRDAEIEHAVASQKSEAASMVRGHSMFADLDESDRKAIEDKSDDEVLDLYNRISDKSEQFLDKFSDFVSDSDQLLKQVDDYLKNPEEHFGEFINEDLKEYARQIQEIAKAELRGEEVSPKSNTESGTSQGEKGQQEVNTDLFGNKITPKEGTKPKQQEMFEGEKSKGTAKQKEIDRLRKDVEAQGGQLKVNQSAKEDQGDKQPINEGIFKPKEEKRLFDGGTPQSTNIPSEIEKYGDYYISDDFYFKGLNPNVKYNFERDFLVEDKPSNRQTIRGVEYTGNGTLKDAIDLLSKVKSIPLEVKTGKKIIHYLMNEKGLTVKELTGRRFGGLPINSLESFKRELSNRLGEYSESIPESIIPDFYRNRVIEVLKEKKDPIDIGAYVQSDLLDIIDGTTEERIERESSKPNFAVPEELDTAGMRKNLKQMYRKIDDAGMQDVNTDDEIAFISKFAESKGYQGQWGRDGQGNERMYFTPIEKEKPSPKTTSYGKNNKVFTEDAAAKARELLKKKLGETRTGLDPEMVQAGITLAGYHIEAGARSFGDYTKAMVNDLGESVKPYLRSWYEGVRYYPEFNNNEGMSTPEQIQELKDQDNESITNPSLESDSNDGKPQDQVGQEDVSGREQEPSGRPDAQREQSPKQRGLFDESDPGVSDDSASPTGKRGDRGLPKSDGGSRQSDTGGKQSGRRTVPGRPRILDGEQGQPGSNTPDPKTFTKKSRLESQKEAENVEPITNDPMNIRESLPLLYPEQQDDVIKFERRINEEPTPEDPKKGMLFTNGTGSGKTFSGLGIVKRFVSQGKTNILIVAPSEKVVSTWMKEARSKFGIKAKSLPDTKTKGEGVRATTYANFRANDELKKEVFDLIIYDESHRLLEDKKGKESGTTQAHYQLSNKNQFQAFQRITANHPVWVRQKDLLSRYREVTSELNKAPDSKKLKLAAEKDEINQELDDLKKEISALTPEIQEEAAKSVGVTKVVFLSATPFKYHFNLRYANGYLFDWGSETTYEQATNVMSRVDPESRFFLDNFGAAYEWKNHQLQTRSDANPEAVSMQEVAFADKLMETGAMSGRKLISDYDYSREFPIVSGFNAESFNTAFNDLYKYDEEKEFDNLREFTKDVFGNYHYSTALYEVLRTAQYIPRLEKHLELGRKGIVFHRRQVTDVGPPFTRVLNLAKSAAQNWIMVGMPEEKEKGQKTLEEIETFKDRYKDLLEYENSLNYQSTVEQLKSYFGEDMIVEVSGKITNKKLKLAAADNFNDDNSPVKIIVVQEESGKEGISLHDTTGNYQRVLASMSLPQSTTTALQVEGRPYRIGNQSNAIYEYPILGLDSEIAFFGSNLNRRLATTENLAMGSQARDLIRSFSEGIAFNATTDDPNENQGKGGKELDRKADDTKTPFEKARLMYATNRKGRKNKLGVDFFATPEPLGQKMMEWLHLQESEEALEPSAGMGSIAMWAPQSSAITAIEPSYELYSKLVARVTNGNSRFVQEQFEDHHLVNKYHGIAMNPPFGTNSKTAWDHTEKGLHHLKIGGRLISILPAGPSLEKRVAKWQETNKDAEQYVLRGKVKLPNVTFEQAGTKVNANVWIWDRTDPRDEQAKNLSYQEVDLSYAETIDEFFDELEQINFADRYATNAQQESARKRVDSFINEAVNGRLENRENDEGTAFTEDSKHEQTGVAQKLVKLSERVDGETFNRYKTAAKKYGGFWWRKKDAFIFQKGDIEDNARRFKNFINNTDTESGRKPDYQYSMARGDGRTANQIDVASKKAGKEYFKSVMHKLHKAFPNIKWSANKQAFENAFKDWNNSDSPIRPNAIRWNDTIYFNPDQIYKDTPIHEFAHIWVELAKNHQGALYKRGLQLVKDSAYHQAVKDNPFYEDVSEREQLEEALVMAIGEKGSVLENQNKFRTWVADLWNRFKRFFGFTPKVDLFNINLEEFVTTSAKELLSRQQISRLSSLRMPETASMSLNTFKTTKDAWKDANDRVVINQLLSENPEGWNKARNSLNRIRWEDTMTGLQDETRPIARVQKEIVDNFIENTKKKINNRTDIDDKQKKRLIKEVENNRPQIKDRLIADNDVHSALDLKSGKVQNAQERVRKIFFGRHSAGTGMGSTLDWLTKDTKWTGEEILDLESVAGKLMEKGMTLLDLGFYSQVKHSPNYNARVRKISFERGDNVLITDGSGMTNEEAEAFMNEYEKDPEKLAVLEEQWQVMKEELVDKPLKMKLKNGIINQKLYDRLTDGPFGETYVPLSVAPKAFAKSPYTSKILGKGIKSIKGTSKYKFYDRVNPFVQLMANFDKSMNDIEQNKVFQKLYNLAMENPEPTYWKIHRPQMVEKMIVNRDDIEKEPLYDQYDDQDMDLMEAIKQEGGDITRDIVAVGKLRPEVINISPAIVERSVGGLVDGKPVYIEMMDDRLLNVFKKYGGPTNEAVRMITSGINSAFTYFRLIYTGANIDFALPNFVRDLQDAMINMSEYEVKRAKTNVIKNLPKAWKGIWDFEKGNEDSPMAKWYADMKANGGEISWLNFTDAEREYKDIEKEILRYQEQSFGDKALNVAMMPFRTAMRSTLLFNKLVEMGTRLSVYKTMVEAGVSRDRAAIAAKNVTVNFNKKGSWNPYLSSLYLFVNAGIQGNARHLTALYRSKKARILTSSMMMSMYMLRYWNDLWDEDDEMDKLLTDFDYENNIVIYNFFNPKMPITIPISYNMKGWKSIADNTYEVQQGKKEITESVFDTFSTFAESMLPMSNSIGVPTILQPPVELAINKKLYSGQPIYRDRMPWDYDKKDSELTIGSPRELSKTIANQLSYAIEDQDDILEISPNSIDYLFDWSLGGMKAVINTSDVVLKLSQKGYGNGLNWNRVMVARRFVEDMEDQTWRHKVNYYKIKEKGLTQRMTPEDKKKFKELGKQLIDKELMSKVDFNSDKKKIHNVQSKSFQNGGGIFSFE